MRVNRAFTEMFGYSQAEAVGQSLDELLAPKDLRAEAHDATRRVASGDHVGFETARRCKDGSLIQVSVLGTPIYYEGGQIAVYGIYRDVTERNNTLRALQASEEKFSTAFRSTPGPATISALETGRLIEVNDAFVEITGHDREAAVGRTTLELELWADPADREHVRDLLERGGMVRDFEYRFRTRGGEERTGLFSADVIELGGERCLLALTNDITDRKRAQYALQRSEEQYRSILETIEDGYYEVDAAGVLISFNSALQRILAYPAGELQGLHYREYMDPTNARRVFATFNDVYATGASARIFDWEVISGDGMHRQVEASVSPVRDEAGVTIGFRGMVRDVTDRRATEQALRESEERYALAARGANDGLWDWNLKTDRVYYSPRWRAMLGRSDPEIGDRSEYWFSLVHPEDVDRLRADIDAHVTGLAPHFENEHRILHAGGSYRWVLCRGVVERDDRGIATRIAGSQTDISDRKRAEERLIHDAFHDALTGLPNRALFTNLLERSLARLKRRKDYRFAVLFLDMDRFKVINDSLGHMLGDQLLIEVARRLSACLRPGDTVARLGGDEFTVLLDDIVDEDDATAIADRIQSELMAAFSLGGHDVFTSVSIGITLSNDGYRRPEEVLRDADTAMYRAKSHGTAEHEIFNADMHERAMSLLKMETDLRHALDRNEFRLVYQPIITLQTGRLAGFEALLRWEHPERGCVYPTEFIQLAEETGVIVKIGQWALWEACRQVTRWMDIPRNGDPALLVSVNLSPKQFGETGLVESVADALAVTGLPASSLKLEITEGVLMDRAEASVRLLDELKASGIQVQVDDFGTGYSSLGYLHRFSLDALKIDQSFVGRVGIDQENTEIVRTIVTLARNLGMAVVAEGVETEEQRAFLRTLDCEHVQGFLFSGPLEPQDAEALIRSGRGW